MFENIQNDSGYPKTLCRMNKQSGHYYECLYDDENTILYEQSGKYIDETLDSSSVYTEKHSYITINSLFEAYEQFRQQKIKEGYLDIEVPEISYPKQNSAFFNDTEDYQMAKIRKLLQNKLNVQFDENKYDFEIKSKTLKLTSFFLENPDIVSQLAKQANVIAREFDGKLIVFGTSLQISEFASLLYDIQSSQKSFEIEINREMKRRPQAIVNYAKSLNVKICNSNKDNKAILHGNEEQVLQIVQALYENETSHNNIQNIFRLQDKSCTIRTLMSPFLRVNMQKVSEAGIKNSVDIISDSNGMTLVGKLRNVTQVQKSLKDIELEAKLKLYPKYWDHQQRKDIETFEVKENSDEFNMIKQTFKENIWNPEIQKVLRIQNKTIMEKFVFFQQKWLEDQPSLNLNKKLLFHGTRNTPPEVLFNSEIGFDLQFARFGAYGKGIYFGATSKLSHCGYGHQVSNENFKMIMAEVLLGNILPLQKEKNCYLRSMPEGYDAGEAHSGTPDNFYIIYKNFQSCPLYIVESKAEKRYVEIYENSIRFWQSIFYFMPKSQPNVNSISNSNLSSNLSNPMTNFNSRSKSAGN